MREYRERIPVVATQTPLRHGVILYCPCSSEVPANLHGCPVCRVGYYSRPYYYAEARSKPGVVHTWDSLSSYSYTITLYYCSKMFSSESNPTGKVYQNLKQCPCLVNVKPRRLCWRHGASFRPLFHQIGVIHCPPIGGAYLCRLLRRVEGDWEATHSRR